MLSFPTCALLALAATVAVTAMPTTSLLSRQTSATPRNMCGTPNDSELIPGTPWIVFSMNYNYQQIAGSVCTGFTGLVTEDGVQKCGWNSTWDLPEAENPDTVKGYSFVGLTQNLESRVRDIKAIPADYHWIRRKETEYKGLLLLCFDFRMPFRGCTSLTERSCQATSSSTS